MAQSLRQNTLTDQNNRPVAGANIYVYDNTGASAAITSDGTTALTQPVITDPFGNYQYYANTGLYSEDIFLGTHRIFKQTVPIGTGADVSTLAALAASGGAALVGYSDTQTYGAGTLGSKVKAVLGNPTAAGGLIGIAPDGNGTLANTREQTTLTGSRTAAVVSRTIEVSDGQAGPASSMGSSTANSASYGLSVVGVRPNWNTSSITGEMDGISVFLRQANGDSAAFVTNVGTRSGFGAFAESYTFSADNTGAVIKAINTQIGVVNSRDGGEYGIVLQATTGSLAAAVRVAQVGSATFIDAFQLINSSSAVLARITGLGAFFGASLTVTGAAPTASAGQLAIGSTTATSATAGASGATPAQVLGYLIMNLGGTAIKVPYYAA